MGRKGSPEPAGPPTPSGSTKMIGCWRLEPNKVKILIDRFVQLSTIKHILFMVSLYTLYTFMFKKLVHCDLRNLTLVQDTFPTWTCSPLVKFFFLFLRINNLMYHYEGNKIKGSKLTYPGHNLLVSSVH